MYQRRGCSFLVSANGRSQQRHQAVGSCQIVEWTQFVIHCAQIAIAGILYDASNYCISGQGPPQVSLHDGFALKYAQGGQMSGKRGSIESP